MVTPADAMTALMRPRSVAVIGATQREGAAGNRVLAIVAGPRYDGVVWGVNPRYDDVDGVPCYASVAALPETPDCVVLVVNDARVEEALAEAAAAGVPAAMIFGRCYEAEPAEPSLAARLAEIAREAGMAVCGGNCMGLLNRVDDVHMCLGKLPGDGPPGGIALLSHSGSTWSGFGGGHRQLALNYAVSTGMEVGATMADYIDFLVAQPETRVIGCVMETMRAPEHFLAAADAAGARGIPVVALKIGRTEKSRAFAFTHSGALAGSDAAFDAAFERHNVVRARTLDEMHDTLEMMACGRAPTTDALGVQTDSGGERQLIVDIADDIGLTLAPLTDATKATLTAALDPGLDPENPVDYWGETGLSVLPVVNRALAADETVGVVALATNLVSGRDILYASTKTIEDTHAATDKPCMVLSNLHSSVDAGEAARLRALGIPVLMGTETGLSAINHLITWHARRGRTAAAPPDEPAATTIARWRERLAGPALGSAEALQLIADFGVAVPACIEAGSRAEAVDAAGRLGYPVVMKTADPAIGHKTDAGGVVLGLASADALAIAYDAMATALGPAVLIQSQAPAGTELLVGMVNDVVFGPVMTVGLGGIFVEVLNDTVTFLPPVGVADATRYLERLKGFALLAGARGRPAADLDALSGAVARLSVLAAVLGDAIAELDVNPLIAHQHGVVAVDALIVPRNEKGKT